MLMLILNYTYGTNIIRYVLREHQYTGKAEIFMRPDGAQTYIYATISMTSGAPAVEGSVNSSLLLISFTDLQQFKPAPPPPYTTQHGRSVHMHGAYSSLHGSAQPPPKQQHCCLIAAH